ncbi:MAG: hypothetical protein R3B60_04925 [Candidatus Paceibacterota bacterium]
MNKKDCVVLYTDAKIHYLCERMAAKGNVCLVVLENGLENNDFVQIQRVKTDFGVRIECFEVVGSNDTKIIQLDIPDEILEKFLTLGYFCGDKYVEIPNGCSVPYNLAVLMLGIKCAGEYSVDCVYWRVYYAPTKQLKNFCKMLTKSFGGKVSIQPVVFGYQE